MALDVELLGADAMAYSSGHLKVPSFVIFVVSTCVVLVVINSALKLCDHITPQTASGTRGAALIPANMCRVERSSLQRPRSQDSVSTMVDNLVDEALKPLPPFTLNQAVATNVKHGHHPNRALAVKQGFRSTMPRPCAACASASRASSKVVHFIRHGTAVHNVRYKRKDEVFRQLINRRIKTEADRENRWLFPEIEEWAYMTNETIDTALVEEGVREASDLGKAWADGAAVLYDRGGTTQQRVPLDMRDVELIVTSPLTRTLQTTMNIFFQITGEEKLAPRAGFSKAHVAAGSSPGNSLGPAPIIALDLIKEWSQGRHTPNRRKNKTDLALQYPAVDFGYLSSESDPLWKEYWPGDKLGLEPRSHLESRVAKFREWLTSRPERNIVVISHGTFLGNLLFGTFIEDTAELAHCQIYRSQV